MKNALIFMGGVITGIIITLCFAYFVASNSSEDKGVIYFEEAGECISENPLEVFQVLERGAALAKEKLGGYNISDLVVLIVSENDYFYDDQVIEIPKGKCARQVGVYNYVTNGGMSKTVPIVEIVDK